jgi:hypothetical protein
MGNTKRSHGLREGVCMGNCKGCKDLKINQKKRTQKKRQFLDDISILPK